MADMYFENLPATTTPLNKTNLDKLNDIKVSITEPNTGENVWIQKANNLFNKNDVLVNERLDAGRNGTYFAEGYVTSAYIRVKPSTSYYISKCNAWHIYTKDFVFINQNYVSGDDTYQVVTTNQNTAWLRISMLSSSLNTCEVHQGTSAINYEPYVEKKIFTKNDNGVYEEFYSGEDMSILNNLKHYSATEQIVGRWVNGKPIYRKAYEFGSIDNTKNELEFLIYTDNIDEMINITGSVNTNYGAKKPLNTIYFDANGNIQRHYMFQVYAVASRSVTVLYGDWWKDVFGKLNLIIEYTKTTD